MALRRTLAKRLFNRYRDSPAPGNSPVHSPSFQKTYAPPNATKANFQRELLTSASDASANSGGFLRRFLQSRGINQSSVRLPEFLFFPAGDKLRQKLSIPGDRLRLEGLSPPVQPPEYHDGLSVSDARKILRSSQLEKLRSALRLIPTNSISYTEFVQICGDVCGNRDQGVEFGKMLDEAGNVIVLGNVVFLRPEQVAKSMEKLITQSIAIPNDARKQELEQMEKQKAIIDRKAESLVRGELYCGLGFLVVQTLGFMRLTFWELSWDVMEPICFFVTSLHFALAYAFFIRTSKEPTFEGYFQRRFKVKQEKLMKIHNFDVEKYSQLCKAFYPNYRDNLTGSSGFRVTGHAQNGTIVFG